MAEDFARVVLGEGDEQQLTDLEPDDYVEFVGSVNGQPIAVRFYRPEDSEPVQPTARVYLDLSTSVLTEGEMTAIIEAPPRVIVHDYGAWVHVPPAEHDEDPLDPSGEGWEDFPLLNAVLRAPASAARTGSTSTATATTSCPTCPPSTGNEENE